MEINGLTTSPLKDKSLWLAILAPVLVMVGKVVGLDLSGEQVLAIVGPLVTFIMASKLKQAHIVASESKAAPKLEELQKMINDALAVGENAKPEQEKK